MTEELKKEGFGTLTEIDVQETLKKKLDVDFRKHKILGACNPPLAYKALQAEDKIGVRLPCNVIDQETADRTVETSEVDPITSMKAINNPDLRGYLHSLTALRAILHLSRCPHRTACSSSINQLSIHSSQFHGQTQSSLGGL